MTIVTLVISRGIHMMADVAEGIRSGKAMGAISRPIYCGDVEGPGDGGQGREDVGDPHGAIEADDDAGRRGSDGPNGRHQDQYAFSASPIRQWRDQWRDQWRHHRRRRHAQQRDQPDRGRSPVPVRHDAQCHSEGPLAVQAAK